MFCSVLYETFKREHFVMHHQLQCQQMSDSQAFRSARQSNIIHSDNFLLYHANLGVQSQKLGFNYTPCCNVEPPQSGVRNLGVATPHYEAQVPTPRF